MGITSSSSNQKRCEGAASRSISGRFANLGSITRGGSLQESPSGKSSTHLVHRREVEKLRPSTLNQAVVALRMFYRDYLGQRWALWERFEIRRDHPLPVVLTREETRRLLGSVRSGRFRAVLALIYHCGLRVGEAVALKPAISTRSAGWRASWKVRAAECARCPSVVRWCERLRRYWSFHRNKRWLFPGVGRGWKDRTGFAFWRNGRAPARP